MDDSSVNLGEEVILTLQWQSGASESATVCFVISLSICYQLLKCGVLRAVRVCVREREREREGVTAQRRACARVCVCVCVRDRERGRHGYNRDLYANTYEHHHATLFPFWTSTDGKTKHIINCLYIWRALFQNAINAK